MYIMIEVHRPVLANSDMQLIPYDMEHAFDLHLPERGDRKGLHSEALDAYMVGFVMNPSRCVGKLKLAYFCFQWLGD